MAHHRTKSIVAVASDDDDEDSTDANETTTNARIPQTNKISNGTYDSHSIITSQIVQDFLIVCFISNNALPTDDLDHFVDQLKKISVGVESFTDANQCVDFLTDVADKRMRNLIIMYACREAGLVSLFGDIPQVCSVYMFETPMTTNKLPQGKIKKFKGVHHDIEEICQSIQKDIHRQWFDSTPLSIISANSPEDLNDLDPSFMYTQLLREVIVEMEYDARKARGDFVAYGRQHFSPLDYSPEELDRFEESYAHHSPIWWYTKQPFIYSNLNKALRTQDTELIMKMGFYIQDVYREAEQRKSQLKVHSKMIVYRGQGLSDQDFEKLQRSKGGLLSFNNFLSTSRNQKISMTFAEDVRDNTNLVGILFEVEIDPLVSSSTFLSVEDLSQFPQEQEILFLMHSVFRIVDLAEIGERLWKVNLTLTDDNDKDLNLITRCLRDEILSNDGWDRVAIIMLRLGKFDKALEIYISTLETTIDDDQEALDLAQVKMMLITGVSHLTVGTYSSDISNLEEVLEIVGRYLPANHFFFVNIYYYIGLAQCQMGDYPLSLSTLERALEILQQSPSYLQSYMAALCNAMGNLHRTMGHYQLALSYIEKALEVQQSFLPHNHPDLAWTCNNLAGCHQCMGNYSKALDYHKKTLIIQQKSLPVDHPQLGLVYCNIAFIHYQLYDYRSSLEYGEKALENRQKSSKADHPDLIVIYQNMGLVYQAMNNSPAAFANFEKALEIQQKSVPSNHFIRAVIFTNIGATHHLIGDCSTALLYLEKALRTHEKSLLMEHPNLAMIYLIIGAVHCKLDQFSLGLSYYEKALEIQQKTLSTHHPDLAKTHYCIGEAQVALGNYLPSLSSWRNAMQSQQAHLSHNQPLTDRSSDSTSVDAQYLQHHSVTMNDMVTLFETAQALSSSSSQPVTLEEIVEFLGSVSNALTNIEPALHFQPNSVLLDRQMFSPGVGNQSLEDASMFLTSCRDLFAKATEKLEVSTANQTDNEDDTEETVNIFDDLSSIILAFQRLVEGDQFPATAAVTGYNYIGEMFCGANQYEQGLVCFQKALEKLVSSFSSDYQFVAKTHNNMATALDGLDRLEEAIYSAEQAVNTASSAFGPDHPDTVTYRNHCHELLEKLQFL